MISLTRLAMQSIYEKNLFITLLFGHLAFLSYFYSCPIGIIS